KELPPSSRIIDAYPKPPQYRAPDRQAANKRRSLDASNLLGSLDDIRPDDPVFVLRRATSYRNSTSRKRFSAPLDEIALQHLHRESTSSYNSSSDLQNPASVAEEAKLKQPSRQEIIAAQRAATRATQRAIVSASTNSVRGMDVLLPGNALLRSSRYEAGDRMRYSYVEPDGETYDVSDIIEEEWRDINSSNKNDILEGVFIKNKDGIVGEKLDKVLNRIRKGKGKERDYSASALEMALESVSREMEEAAADRDRVRDSKDSRDSRAFSTLSASEYSTSADEADATRSRSVTPGSAALTSRMPGLNQELNNANAHMGTTNANARATPISNPEETPRPGTTTPTAGFRTSPSPVPSSGLGSRRNPSIASVMSDYERERGRGTPDRGTPTTLTSNLSRVIEEDNDRSRGSTPTKSHLQQQSKKKMIIPKDDFGIEQMMAIIEFKASLASANSGTSGVGASVNKKLREPMHPVDELLFGPPVDLDSLHPAVRDVYASGFKQLEEADKILDSYISRSAVGAF
ncbi:hypothetical protein CVT26_004136, partial [Gymnopilus dilepis]